MLSAENDRSFNVRAGYKSLSPPPAAEGKPLPKIKIRSTKKTRGVSVEVSPDPYKVKQNDVGSKEKPAAP